MAALVDYTALTEATGWTDGFPICASTPVDGVATDYWRKVRLDFSKTNLATADWIKFMVIPAHTYVHEIMTHVLTADAGATALVFGDAAGDASETWLATAAGDVADIVKITLVADTNGATRGKYYHTAGALYMSPTGICDTLLIDVYVHCMNMDPE
jgi:hypothetical protein